MLTSNVCFGIIFFFQTTVGTLANFFLLLLYIFNFLHNYKSRPLLLILTQIILANITMLVIKGSPEMLHAFQMKNFLDDIGCKMMFFLYRIAHGLSVCFTCLLCIFQAIIISPNNSTLSEFKSRVPEYIPSFCLVCWIFNILLEIPVLIFVRQARITTNNTIESNILYCSLEMFIEMYFIMTTLRNVLCVGIMLWSSSYMVVLLHRHHQQVQNIHSTSFLSRVPPEIRATQTILLLMGIFVSFYLLHTISLISVTYLDKNGQWLTFSPILSLSFSTLCPFVLLPKAPKHNCILWTRKDADSILS
ncbi:vomeronasal 1 receptor monDomV1R1220 [Monodelphis domestica]|uniref:Vomeronasal type-1 receptor n=1 Tax=Monodelphis domestica TaxID=13616 RepID=A0A5F8H5J5_MONDO|nr:vomeronasal 1 receptor monDomV1R1220 [Monodelphis domestica]